MLNAFQKCVLKLLIECLFLLMNIRDDVTGSRYANSAQRAVISDANALLNKVDHKDMDWRERCKVDKDFREWINAGGDPDDY